MYQPKTANTRSVAAILLLVCAASISIVIGLGGALFGWFGQIFILTVLVPVSLLIIDYRIGLYAIVLLTPFAGAQFIPKVGPLSIVNLLLVGVLGVMTLRLVLMRIAGRPSRLIVPKQYILFYLLPITVGFVVGSPHLKEIPPHLLDDEKLATLSNYWISTYFKGILFTLCGLAIAATIAERRNAIAVVYVSVLSAVLYVLVSATLFFFTSYTLEEAVNSRQLFSASGRHANGVGMMLVIALSATLYITSATRRGVRKVVLASAALIIAAGILLTASRGALLAMLCVLVVYAYQMRKIRTALSILLVAAATVIALPDAIYDRLTMGIDILASDRGSVISKDERLTSGRLYLASQLLPEIAESPLFGHGMLSTRWSQYAKNGGQIGTPHNLYLAILMDMGLLGLVLLLCFVVFVHQLFNRLSQSRELDPVMRAYFQGGKVSLYALLIFGLSGGAAYPLIEHWFLWVSFGVALGVSELLRQSDHKQDQNVDSHQEGLKAAFWGVQR